MNDIYFNYLGTQSANILTHIALIDENGTELNYVNTIYNRIPVEWEIQTDGTLTPTVDLVFDIPGSGDSANPNKVAGFRMFDAETNGTDYGGKDIQIKEYVIDGQYTLPQDKIFIHFNNVDIEPII